MRYTRELTQSRLEIHTRQLWATRRGMKISWKFSSSSGESTEIPHTLLPISWGDCASGCDWGGRRVDDYAGEKDVKLSAEDLVRVKLPQQTNYVSHNLPLGDNRNAQQPSSWMTCEVALLSPENRWNTHTHTH